MMTVTFRVTGGYCCPPPVLDGAGNVLRPGGDKIASGDTLRMPLDQTALPDLPEQIDMVIVSATPTTFPPSVPGGPHLAGYTYVAEYDETLLPSSVTSLRECDLLRTQAECLSCCDLLWEAIGALQDRTSVLDTSTVDLTLSGTTITATAIIKPDSGLEATSTGIGAKVVDSTSVDLSLSSTGISAVVKPSASGGVIIDGPGGPGVGVKPDPSSPVSVGLAGVKIYSDPAGPITAGPSGINVTVNPSGPVTSGPSGLNVGVLSTTSVAMTASPSGISSVVLPTSNGGVVVDGPLGSGVAVKPDGTKGIDVGAGGVSVKVSAAAGNELVFKPDGSLFVAPPPVIENAAPCDQPVTLTGDDGSETLKYSWADIRPSVSAEISLPLNPDGKNSCGLDTILSGRGDGNSTTAGDIEAVPDAGYADQIFIAQLADAPNGDTQLVIGNQRWEGNVVYVDGTYGLDIGGMNLLDAWRTPLGGIRGRGDRPFATLQAAHDAAFAGDVIVIRPGTYAKVNVTKSVNFLATPGVRVSAAGLLDGAFNFSTPGVTSKILGFPDVAAQNFGTGIFLNAANLKVDFELGGGINSLGCAFYTSDICKNSVVRGFTRGDWQYSAISTRPPSESEYNRFHYRFDGNAPVFSLFGFVDSHFEINGSPGSVILANLIKSSVVINGDVGPPTVDPAVCNVFSTNDCSLTVNGNVIATGSSRALQVAPYSVAASVRPNVLINGCVMSDAEHAVTTDGNDAAIIHITGKVVSQSGYGWYSSNSPQASRSVYTVPWVESKTTHGAYLRNDQNVEWKGTTFKSPVESVSVSGNGGMNILDNCRLVSGVANAAALDAGSFGGNFKVYGGPLATNAPILSTTWVHMNPLVNPVIVDATVTE